MLSFNTRLEDGHLLRVLQGAAFVATEDQFFFLSVSPQLVRDEWEPLGEPRSALLRSVICHLQDGCSTPGARPRCPLSSISPHIAPLVCSPV